MLHIDIQTMLSDPCNLRLHCLVEYISLIVTTPVCQGYCSHMSLTFKDVYCISPSPKKAKNSPDRVAQLQL